MKIVHYHKSILLETGGVVRAVLDLCSMLAAAGHDVSLLSPNPKDVPQEWTRGKALCPRVFRTASARRFGQFFLRHDLQAIADEHFADADVVHLHGMWGPFNAQLASAARARGIPYIYSVHGMLDDWSMAQRGLKKRLYLSLLGRHSLQRAAAVHCTAQAELDQACKWFPNGRGVVLPLVVDLSDYQSLPGPELARARFTLLRGDRPVLLFLSRLHYKKGVELLIHATDSLRRSGVDVSTVIAGSGDASYLTKLQDLSRSLSLEDHVIFAGFVGGQEKISLFQAADLFVLPTSQENFGFVLFESLATETPVITTRGADTWPELEASGGAVIVETDPQAIADAARELLQDKDRRREMGRVGREWVFANLSADAIRRGYEKLYADAAQSR